jgi:NAD(P) transhydrogenase subunit alpha
MLALLLEVLPDSGVSEDLPFIFIGLWILLLAIFVGFEVITKVPPTLHTPLMSGANAISGITIVGALYCAGAEYPGMAKAIGFLAIAFASINVVGGFLVTDRMLGMFGGKGRKEAK